MSKKERLEDILALLKKYGYVSVQYLTEALHYSTATINRDLNYLQDQRLVKRSYGGVELTQGGSVPLPFRYHKMRVAKNHIAKCAAEFIQNGDTVFIDGTTTTQRMGQYLTDRRDLTVITNNMALAAYLSRFAVKVICLGGTVSEPPSMLMGHETVDNAARFHADKTFISAGGITEDGRIAGGSQYYYLHRTMMANSTASYLLADHSKVCANFSQTELTCGDFDVVICDYRFSDEVKQHYPNTRFVTAQEG